MLGEIYRRAIGLIGERPLVLLVPFLAELLQHVAEIELGFYDPGVPQNGRLMAIRLGFGLLKLAALLFTLIFALRYWRSEGDARWAIRIGRSPLQGLAIFISVQLAAYAVILPLGFGLGRISGHPLPFLAISYLCWLFVSTLLLPWFVGMLAEDRAMGLRHSIAAIRPVWLSTFALFLGGIVPLMALHIALGHGAMGRPSPLVWLLMLADAGLVALLIHCIASTYFAIYRRAAMG